jgi:carbon-monoxide dehydrogenase large subunit
MEPPWPPFAGTSTRLWRVETIGDEMDGMTDKKRAGLVGTPTPRVEDFRFLTGRGRYTDDEVPPGLVWGVVVRSVEAHARILSIDIEAARDMPGVLAILTAVDAEADALGTIDPIGELPLRDGSAMRVPPRRVLNGSTVRYVGDPVAFVVAETRDQAKDAAEAVWIEYESLPAVVDLEAVRDGTAPAIDPEWADNLAFHFAKGDGAATDAALAEAAHVTRLDLKISRVQPTPLEPRSAIGAYDAQTGRYELRTGSQAPWRLKTTLAGDVLKIPPAALRVISPDMGGGFGNRSATMPEHALVLWAAKRLGRPVAWRADRLESFQSDDQARHSLARAELGLDADGRFTAMRVHVVYGMGAYHSQMSTGPATNNIGVLAGVYRIPAMHVEVDGAFLNVNPASAYRGAGRPEACYILERTIDTAARELGLDPAELRRRNMIPPAALPYKTALTYIYDSGDFRTVLDRALVLADRDGFAERRKASEAEGRLRGFGLACSIESAGSPARGEQARLRLREDGGAELTIGTHSHGQGHETAFRQVLADDLGIAIGEIDYIQGDTDTLEEGGGTAGSRSAAVGGGVIRRAAVKLIEAARAIAADALEASEQDVEFEHGRFQVAGTDHAVTWAELAAHAADRRLLAKLQVADEYAVSAAAFPNGCAAAEVEIDRDTGSVSLVRYSVVGDYGTILNPMLLEGQVHGGVAQGAGQILLEELRWDEDTGQLVTGSFMDYGMPRAKHLPMIAFESAPTPTEANLMGAKGVGEAGCVSALPAVMNAVVDALAPLGVRTLDMPTTPERVWSAIRAACGGE